MELVIDTLTGNTQVRSQLLLYDQMGKQVFTQRIAPGEDWIHLVLDESRFPPGLYYVTMMTGDVKQTQRLMLLH